MKEKHDEGLANGVRQFKVFKPEGLSIKHNLLGILLLFRAFKQKNISASFMVSHSSAYCYYLKYLNFFFYKRGIVIESHYRTDLVFLSL